MNKFGFVLLMSVLFATQVFAQEKNNISQVDFTARDMNGKKFQLKKQLESGPVILDFWALWCVPCLKAMPQLKKIQKKYADSGLSVVVVNEDSPSDQAKVKPYIKQKRFNFKVLLDEDKDLWDKFNLTGLPFTLLINSNGEIVYTHSGYKPGDESELIAAIDELLLSEKNAEMEDNDTPEKQ